MVVHVVVVVHVVMMVFHPLQSFGPPPRHPHPAHHSFVHHAVAVMTVPHHEEFPAEQPEASLLRIVEARV